VNWEEVQKQYPDQWVKLKIKESNISEGKKKIEDMEVIKTINDEKKVGRELGSCNDDEIVYHTSREEIFIEVKNIFGFRSVK